MTAGRGLSHPRGSNPSSLLDRGVGTQSPVPGSRPESPSRLQGGVLTSCSASRHKFSLGCGVETQRPVPGSRKEGTRCPVLGPDPFPPSGGGCGGDPAFYTGVPTRVPHLDRGVGGHSALSCYCAGSRASGHSLWSRGRRREDRTAPNGPLGSKGGESSLNLTDKVKPGLVEETV